MAALENYSSDDWLGQQLRCPYDGEHVASDRDAATLACPRGHAFPIVHGVPVMLRRDVAQTHTSWWTTPAQVAALAAKTPVPLGEGEIDPFVRQAAVATCGLLYRGLRHPLPRYPIASLEALPPGEGRLFLDVGGNWGRWALGASARGYRAVVVDPSLRAALAGGRIARQLGRDVRYVVGDGRHLPFAEGSFAVSFSYSVLQSLDKDSAGQTVREMGRVTEPGGKVRVQMANVLGLRRLTKSAWEEARNRLRALLRPGYERWMFRVRPWTPGEIRRLFEELVGPTELSIDGFLTLNAQTGDVDLLKRRYAAIVRVSEALRALARVFPPLTLVADSLYAQATNTRGASRGAVPARA